mmetsp:Transcript_31623/g.79977  ORF Transcript_31623/g.79977 Transcript_31623/m.79977 type:complete len:285 (-) Transcript_31623:338-1192(-)
MSREAAIALHARDARQTAALIGPRWRQRLRKLPAASTRDAAATGRAHAALAEGGRSAYSPIAATQLPILGILQVGAWKQPLGPPRLVGDHRSEAGQDGKCAEVPSRDGLSQQHGTKQGAHKRLQALAGGHVAGGEPAGGPGQAGVAAHGAHHHPVCQRRQHVGRQRPALPRHCRHGGGQHAERGRTVGPGGHAGGVVPAREPLGGDEKARGAQAVSQQAGVARQHAAAESVHRRVVRAHSGSAAAAKHHHHRAADRQEDAAQLLAGASLGPEHQHSQRHRENRH